MEARADARVGRRCRTVSAAASRCGSELVGAPRALVLDEPTTGLDPDLQRRLMRFLRGLADAGLPVVLSTHSTSSLDLCDRIAVLAPGGRVSFTGTRAAGARALRRDDDRRRLRRHARAARARRRRRARAGRASRPPGGDPPPLPAFAPQVRTLTSRYWNVPAAPAALAGHPARAGADHRPRRRPRAADVDGRERGRRPHRLLHACCWPSPADDRRDLARGDRRAAARSPTRARSCDREVGDRRPRRLATSSRSASCCCRWRRVQVVLLILPLLIVRPLDVPPGGLPGRAARAGRRRLRRRDARAVHIGARPHGRDRRPRRSRS